ncbi:bucky ball-like isoform X1 [Lepisosteus oculatus]|uniref:bucky ball-like isoform X1 n=1 Tax=Lepisosteus oculatus TaxID=7918 RepID=UPI00371F5D15
MAAAPHPVGNGQHPEEQTRPFFYVQPSPPYFPYHWHMPMPYHAYGGFPGLGYGLGFPPLPPNPYMEIPGYIVPQAQLHPADYRRLLNPHFPPTMAYHARRFRYQQNTTSKETTSSEVQTDPAVLMNDSQHSGVIGTCVGGAQAGRSDSVREARHVGSFSNSIVCSRSEKQDVPGEEAGSLTSRVTSPKSFVFQKEEVRIECRDMPSTLKIFRSRETTAESSPSTSGNLVQCDVWSVSSTEGVMPLYSSTINETNVLQNAVRPEELQEQCVPAFPDVLLLGASPPNAVASVRDEKKPAVHKEHRTRPNKKGSAPVTEQDPRMVQNDKGAPRHLHEEDGGAKPVEHVPADNPKQQCEVLHVEDLKKAELSGKSVTKLDPHVSPEEWLAQQGKTHPEKATEEPFNERAPDSHVEQMETGSVANSQDHTTGKDKNENEEGWPVETLPPYVPSASWLADFGNVYYFSKLPQSVQDHLSIFSTSKDAIRMGKKAKLTCEGPCDPMDTSMQKRVKKRHSRLLEVKGTPENEGFCNHLINRNALNPNDEGAKRCTHCLSKQNAHGSSDSKALCGHKRHKLTQQTADLKQTCAACRYSSTQVMKVRGPEAVGHYANEDLDHETLEVKGPSEPLKQNQESRTSMAARKRILSKRVSENNSVFQSPKVKEKRNSGKEAKLAYEYSHPDAMKECNAEVMVTSTPGKCKEKAWRESVSIPDKEDWENYGARPRNTNKERKTLPQSQEKNVSYMPLAQRHRKNAHSETLERDQPRPNRTRGSSNRRGTRH